MNEIGPIKAAVRSRLNRIRREVVKMFVKELNFPMVYHDDAVVGYGGNQEWFSQNMKRKAGCGCTCGANLAAYYASNYPQMARFYEGNREKFDRTEFLRAMEELHTYMKPGMIGYPYAKRFGNQFVRFCRERGVDAEAKFCYGFRSREEAVSFVRESIDGGNPVALLILFHRAYDLRNDNWHWVTITGYAEEEDNPDNIEIILSNCGERQTVSSYHLFEVHRKNTIRMVSFRIA